MYRGYKIVCNTAAGRRRYMRFLFPQVLSSEIIDRYDIWVNTIDNCDIEFFKLLAAKYAKINLIWQPNGRVDGIATINAFYRFCTDEDTIYVKMDDDVVWLEPEYFKKMVDFRIEHPECFIVSPLVINNALSTYILQVQGKVKLCKYMNAQCNHRITWKRGSFAAQLHQWFLDNYLTTGKYKELYCGSYPWAMNRFSINSILWFGKDLKVFDGIVQGDDEEFFSCLKPTQLGKINMVNANCLIAHFSFAQQRWMLDKCGILEQYGKFLFKDWETRPELQHISDDVQMILKDINQRQSELNSLPPVYQTRKIGLITQMKRNWKAWMKQMRCLLDGLTDVKYIVNTTKKNNG